MANGSSLSTTSSADTPMSFHFDFDRAEQLGLVARQPDAAVPQLPRPYAASFTAATYNTETTVSNVFDRAMSSRQSEAHLTPQMIAEPIPGKRIGLVPVSSLCEWGSLRTRDAQCTD